jgi:chitinase
MRYPEASGVFFSVPNGGARNAWTAKNLRDEGALRGVSDLLLLVPRHGFAGLCIEMKRPNGKVSDAQKAFKKAVERFKYKYVVCYSVDEFKAVMADYLEK